MVDDDQDPTGTDEWREALESVLAVEGPQRAHDLLDELIAQARAAGAPVPYSATTPYVNTIAVEDEPPHPGDRAVEHRIRSAIRWNAVATVLRANKESSELGGHIASFQSAATLYDTGFQHFWHAPSAGHGGDLVMMQGHSSPGIYARAFLEGRLTEEQMDSFRQEADGSGLSSYPHPWLMPDFWQFPTVSMGLGPLMAIYQARFLKYLQGRGLAETENRHVWAFLGDGEMDEPESLGAISLAGREHLDNLIFVVNCNLQRLDGPVRGNGKIIQELEGLFRGAGWNVIKVIWGSRWDQLLASGRTGRPPPASDGGDRRRRVPDVQVQGRRLRPRALLRPLPGDRGHGRGLDRRGDLGADARRARPVEDLRGLLRGGGRARPAHGDPRQDRQGLRHGRGRRGPEHLAPAEEDGAGEPAALPRPLRPLDRRRRHRVAALPALRPRQRGGDLPPEAPRGARWLAARASPHVGGPGGAGPLRLRRPARRLRRPRELHDDGVRPRPEHAAAGQEDRQARGADRPGRVAHVRHGGHVPPVRDLLPGRAALHARGRRPADVLQGGQRTASCSRRASTSWARCRRGSRRRRRTPPATSR